jgi:hypothetical protein
LSEDVLSVLLLGEEKVPPLKMPKSAIKAAAGGRF